MILNKRKIAIVYSMIASIFVILSCTNDIDNNIVSSNKKKKQDSPEIYMMALNSKLNEFNLLATNAYADKIIDLKEAQNLNNHKKNIDEFQNEIDTKFKNNPVDKSKIEELYQQNVEIITKYNDVIEKLKICKGSEHLQF